MSTSFTSDLSELDYLDLSEPSDNETTEEQPTTPAEKRTEQVTGTTATREPPAKASGYAAQVFDISWDKILLSNGQNAIKHGALGYRVAHRSQIGGSSASRVWEYGADLLYTPDNDLPKRYWLCRICHLAKRYRTSFLTASGLKAIHAHLRREHKIGKDGEKILQTEGPLVRHLSTRTRALQDFDPEKQRLFSSAFPDWVVQQNLSFRQATSKETVALFQLLRKDTDSMFYTSATGLSRVIRSLHDTRADEVRSLLKNALSRIHISCDLWSSPNNKSLLGVVGHFLDCDFKPKTVLLGLPRIWGGHDGSNVAQYLLTVTHKYEITERLGCFMMDNATSNDTLISALQLEVKSVSKEQRLRCAGHIINLVVKAILYGDGISEFNRKIIGCSDSDAFTLWRKFGAIGKVHNTVKYIMRSDQRRQYFLSLQRRKKGDGEAANSDMLFEHAERLLIKDGGVRWNSTYYMMYRAFELREYIDKFQQLQPMSDSDNDCYMATLDRIRRADWEEIKLYLRLLRNFVEATAHLEGNADHEGSEGSRGSLWEVLPWMQAMYDEVTKAITKQERAEADTPFLSSLKLGREKLDEYFSKLINDTSYYYAAVVLHPDYQLAWFQDHWRKFPRWTDTVKKGMKSFVREYIDGLQKEQGTPEPAPPSPVRVHKVPDVVQKRRDEAKALGILDSDDDDDPFVAVLTVDRDYSNHDHRTKHPRVQSELDAWYNYRSPAKVRDQPLQFWIRQAQDKACPFPSIAKLALDIYSIPAMSSECERVFSETKRIITDDRNQLGEDTIEALQCQKNWLDSGIVHSDLRIVASK